MKNNIEKKENKINECTSCQMCSSVCPYNAIHIELDNEGFYKPVVDNELCVSCGICVKTCYKYDNNIAMTINASNLSAYSAVSRDDENLKTSTSGGASSILMSSLLEQGYSIVGVEYDYDKDIAVTNTVYSVLEIDKFKGSKYMQSYTEETFKEIVKEADEKKYAIFGTPCHIYPMNKWAVSKGKREQFVFIDIFCHGCPSMYLWKKYLDDVKEKAKVTKFEKIEFRSKEYGWHEYSNTFHKGGKRFISGKAIKDPFFTLFFDDQLLCKACYECKLRSTLEYTDIRLGDYWGDKFDLDIKGVSAVIACTTKGKEVFDVIKDKMIIKSTNLDDIIKAQSYGKSYNCSTNARHSALVLLKSDKNMNEIFKEYTKMYSIKKKIYIVIRKLLYLLPISVRNMIRKIYHKK